MTLWRARQGGSVAGTSNKIKPSGKSLLIFWKEHTHTFPQSYWQRTLVPRSTNEQKEGIRDINSIIRCSEVKHCQRKRAPLRQTSHREWQIVENTSDTYSQAHNIKNNKQSDGCLGHFVFHIGLKGNHNSNTANITSYKRLLPYKKLWPLSSTPWLELCWFVMAS